MPNQSLHRVLLIAAVLLTAHVAAARGITSRELIGTWIIGTAGADTVYGTFRSGFTYSITHSERPWGRGKWKLSPDGKKLSMINAVSGEGDTTVIKRFDGRVLHLTNGHDAFTWKRVRGTEAAAISVAVERFKKMYARPDLRHYSIETERHGQELEVTFISDKQSCAPGEAGTGGGSRFGPDMTYVVSLTSLKILRFNYYR